MDQDETWHRGRPQPQPHCVRWGPHSAGHSAINFGPCIVAKIGGCCVLCIAHVLWPKGWMDQDATSYGGRSRHRRHCVRWGLRSPKEKGEQHPSILAHVLWSNGWIKVPLGTGIGLGLGHIVLYGDPATPKEAAQQPPIFGPCLL